MRYITKKDIILPKRKSNSHKGENGRVLIVGGSEEYVGALVLAGKAALRASVDWVTIVAPEKVGWAVSSLSSDLVVKKVKGKKFEKKHVKEILELEKDFDAILIGNGIGMESRDFVCSYVKKSKKKKIIDADGIKHVSSDIVKNSIITPHEKELEIFLTNSGIKNDIIKKITNEKNINKKATIIKKILRKFLDKNNVILLKGKVDVIISKDKIAYNKTGNAGMTKAGTGDVLAGLCVSFLGQGLTLFQSAVNAAYFNGLAGDILMKKKKGFTYLASDLAEEISEVVRLFN